MNGNCAFVAPDAPEWRAALEVVQHPVYHCPEYVAIEAGRLGGRPAAFVYCENGSFVLLPLILQQIPGSAWSDAISPYGYSGPLSNLPVGDYDYWGRFCAALTATMRAEGVLSCFVRLNPLFAMPEAVLAQAGTIVRHGLTVALDLRGTAESLWASMRKNHRRDIEKARGRGLHLVMNDWSQLPEFIHIYRETMIWVAAANHYFFDEGYFQALAKDLQPYTHLGTVVQGGEVLAGGILLTCGGIAQYHLMATRTEALSLQPSKLAVFDMALWAKERGSEAFHLGGGVGSSQDALFHFKAGFSPWHLPFSTWRLVSDRDAYVDLVVAQQPQRDPTDLQGFFPAYRSV